MPNFSGNEDLGKLSKEYISDLLCKFSPFCLQHFKTFDISHAFLLVTIAELSMLKQIHFFWPTLYPGVKVSDPKWQVTLHSSEIDSHKEL